MSNNKDTRTLRTFNGEEFTLSADGKTIVDPGKFEGLPAYMPTAYFLSLDGFCETDFRDDGNVEITTEFDWYPASSEGPSGHLSVSFIEYSSGALEVTRCEVVNQSE